MAERWEVGIAELLLDLGAEVNATNDVSLRKMRKLSHKISRENEHLFTLRWKMTEEI